MSAVLYYDGQAFALTPTDVTAIRDAVAGLNGVAPASAVTLEGGQTVVIAPGVPVAFTT